MQKQKQKFTKYLAITIAIVGVGIVLGDATDSHALSAIPLQVNPEYNRYVESVNTGHGGDWKIIPQKYIPIVSDQGINLGTENALPAAYDLRSETCGDDTCATKVKDQGQEGICWAYAATTAVESNVLKATGKKIELSPKQLDYALASPTTALSDGANNNYHKFISGLGIDRSLGDGGNFQIANYFMGGIYGPTLEAPFFNGMKANDPNLSSYNSYEERAAVGPYTTKMPSNLIFQASKENNYIPTSTSSYSVKVDDPAIIRMAMIQAIKQQIMNHGALSLSTWFNRDSSTCYDAASKTIMDHGDLTCGVQNGHAMSIIGWDDNHSYNDPATNTTKRGAFLVQNSWGTSTDYTYVYLSYDYRLNVDGINKAEPNRWDIIYDVSQAQKPEGITRAKDEIITKYHAAGEQVIDQVTLNDIMGYTGTGKVWDVYISTTGKGDDFQQVGTIDSDTPLIYGRRIAQLNNNITVNGDFLIKVKSAIQGADFPDETAAMFAINAYATGDIGPQPSPTPSPSPDIPVPSTGGEPTVGVPNTGFLSNGGAILATVIVVPMTVTGIIAGRTLARRYGHRVSFKK